MNAEERAPAPSNLTWFKSSRSSNEGGACVEAAIAAGAVFVRDSKDPRGPRLSFSAAAWRDVTRFAARSRLG